jgi:hypothetical protein
MHPATRTALLTASLPMGLVLDAAALVRGEPGWLLAAGIAVGLAAFATATPQPWATGTARALGAASGTLLVASTAVHLYAVALLTVGGLAWLGVALALAGTAGLVARAAAQAPWWPAAA